MQVVFAKYTATVITGDGGRRMVHRGEYWPATDPVVQAAPADMFSPDPRDGLLLSSVPLPDERPVEAATAAPGERRAGARRG